MSYNKDLYQQVILDHNKNPKNFCEMNDATHSCIGYNPFCGDNITVYLKVDYTGAIENVSFLGTGCAISKASTSLMTVHLKGKKIDEAKKIFEEFRKMVTGNFSPEEKNHKLGKLTIFEGVKEFPSRVKCATLSWHCVIGALKGKKETSTE